MIVQTLRGLVVDNPMILEGTRAWRRFLRTSMNTGRTLNRVLLSVIGLMYLGMLCSIVRAGEDANLPLLMLQLGVLTLIVPGSLYSAISGEREKMTWDALILTRLTPEQIVVGKLLWRFALVGAVMLVFLPLLLLCEIMFGSDHHLDCYTPRGLLNAESMTVAWTFLLGAFTLWVSAKTKRSVTSLSMVVAGLLISLVLLPTLASMFGAEMVIRATDSPLAQFGGLMEHLNPATVLMSLTNGRIVQTDDLWYTANIAQSVPAIYGGGGLLFLIGAWRALRGLGAARKRL